MCIVFKFITFKRYNLILYTHSYVIFFSAFNISGNNTPTPLSENRQNSIICNSRASTIPSYSMQSSSSTKLKAGTHKLKRKSTDIQPIPIVDLTEYDDIDDEVDIHGDYDSQDELDADARIAGVSNGIF